MAKKKEITLENIKKLESSVLAELIYEQILKDDIFYKKVEKYLLKNNQKALIKNIKKEISSIKRGKKFIDYYRSFEFSKKIDDIVETIEKLVDDKKDKANLYKELILTDSNVFSRSDDSSGVIQGSYFNAIKNWCETVKYLDEIEIYKHIKDLLICEGFGVRVIFCENIPNNILQKIYNEYYENSLKEKTKIEEWEYLTILTKCAHYLKSPELYIKAHKLFNRFDDDDLLDIAKEFKYIDDAKNTLIWLEKIKNINLHNAGDYFSLKIWAYDKLNDKSNVIENYKKWIEIELTPEIFKEYLNLLDENTKKLEKKRILENAKFLSYEQALRFFYELNEKEKAVSLILKNTNEFNKNINDKFLKNLVEWLKFSHPDIAILLLRRKAEYILEMAISKYYPQAIKYLKLAKEIEENYPNFHSKIDNEEYFKKLLQKHSKKTKFKELFYKAFKEK
jgi:pterin-4a-carbinolamine dehydratase